MGEIQEKNVGSITIENAQKEYRELLSKYVKKEKQRTEELEKANKLIGLDGPNYYKDIQEWFNEEVEGIKEKYSVLRERN